MLKRLIEVALPLKEVSEQSAREKSIRHGHISTLHIWWARRPLAACRAVVFASLIPDPDDPECPASFRSLVNELLNENEFKPKTGEGSTTEDTARNRCLEYIKHLVRWENSNKPHYIEPACKLIAAAHKFLHPHAGGDTPKVLDPFTGGGAIPLEALRLGCEAYAIDINPVAHLIQLCTLVYPQKYGQSNSRPVPNYIKRLIAHNKAKKKAKGQDTSSLFDSDEKHVESAEEVIPDVEITEAEYHKNPLVADVTYWGHWVLEKARRAIGQLYPADANGNVPVAYLWARSVKCPNPGCGATIPLIQQLWLSKKGKVKNALRIVTDSSRKDIRFEVAMGKDIDSSATNGTMRRGRAECLLCSHVVTGEELRRLSKAGLMYERQFAVVTLQGKSRGKAYRPASDDDTRRYDEAVTQFPDVRKGLPTESIPADRPSPNSRGFSAVVRYGIDQFGKLFNHRQAITLTTFASLVREAIGRVRGHSTDDYALAVACYLGVAIDRLASFNNSLVRWASNRETAIPPFSKNGVPMIWDYGEINPFSESTGDWNSAIDWVLRVTRVNSQISNVGNVSRCSATATPFEQDVLDAIVTDPPYYDAVPYSDLSDFFYVWLKRTLADVLPDCFRTPLTPKNQELIAYYGAGKRTIQKTPDWYEQGMGTAFTEMGRIVRSDGIICVMFAHKTTAAWETLISGLLTAGMTVTASWPLHTERPGRLLSIGTASLASSVTLICRKRSATAGDGLWDDVRKELKPAAKERLDFFWSQGIRGADFFISAIGPALSVFGKYERVTKLSGDEVSVGQFLDEVRSLVTAYALNKIMKTTHTATIDPDSQFYVIWKWSYGEAKVPADEGFKLAQALGMDTESMWDRTGILEKASENLLAVPVAKRMKIKNLGEPNADTTPASLIDVLHRLCVFREKNDTEGMAEFLGRSGQGRNSNLWLVAQAVSEILPDGDKEKQLMQGLLNQKDGLQEATREKRLF